MSLPKPQLQWLTQQISESAWTATSAINVFLHQSLRAGGFSFEVRLEQSNKEIIATMLEAERIALDPSVKHYSDVEKALWELKNSDQFDK